MGRPHHPRWRSRVGATGDEAGVRLFDGVRVLDLSRMLAGPYGSMLLADMGAEVIKIEEPDGGDPMRVMGPPFLPDGESAYFLSINRNKKSIAIDLSRAGRARGVPRPRPRHADVVWENFRPGVMERLGCDYATLAAVNPRLIMCSISAYGQDGPYRDWPAFDLALQAMGGAMSRHRRAGRAAGAHGPADGRSRRRHVRRASPSPARCSAARAPGRARTSTSRCSTARSRC